MAIVFVVAPALAVGVLVFAVVLGWPRAPLDAPRIDIASHPGAWRVVTRLRTRFDPVTETGLLLSASVGVVVFAAVTVGVLLAMVRSNRGLASYDVRISTYAARHATASSTSVLKRVNALGGTGVAVLGSMIVGAVEYRRRGSPHVLGFLALVVAGQFAVANTIKFLVNRTRPAIDPLSGFSSSSFPSGHATAAAAGFAAFAMLLGSGRTRAVRAGLTGAAASIAVAVAMTRVFLGVHWLTDVIGGLCVGWGWFTLCSLVYGGRRLRFGEPVKRTSPSPSAHEQNAR